MRGQGNLPGALRPVSSVAVRVDLDPWLSLSGLSGYSGLSVRTLRLLLHHPDDPLPHYRVGAMDRRAGRRGAKILVRRSEFDRWMLRWKQQQAPLPRDLGGILDRAVAELTGRRVDRGGQVG